MRVSTGIFSRAHHEGWRRALPFGATIIAALLTPIAARPQSADTSVKVTFGAFVDGYYAYDFSRPPSLDRSFAGGATFTTQPARHGEFNVNLAYVEAQVAGNRVRGRLALQAGTSVQSNYAGEPTRGTISGPLLSRMLQEAYGGYRVTPALWIDGGIFYSHLGMETWASKDNPTYTRSLVADYSPYYSAGVRAVWRATPRLTAHLHVVNGWQNISETNTDKGVGLRLDLAATSTSTVSYYNFFNTEVGGRLRVFNGVGARAGAGATTFLGELDYGRLGAPSTGGNASTWYGFTAVLRQQLAPTTALNVRAERYDDEDQINIVTGLANPFRGNGGSIGIDVVPQPRVLWRTEARGFRNETAVFPDGARGAPSKTAGFIVSSLALSF